MPVRELRFERLLEAAPDAMVIVDKAGRIVLANSRTEEIFGYMRAELLGRPVEILIPEQYRQRHESHRGEYAAAPRKRPMGTGLELSGLRRDGSVFPVEISLSPLEEGDESLFIAAIRDVSDRKKADEALRLSEQRFRLLVDEVKDYAIFMLDPRGRVASWNAGAEKIKGYEPDEIIGQHFSRFYPSEDVDAGKPEEELKIAAAEGRVEDEGWRIRKDGSRFWASVVITALHDSGGKLLGFTKVTRDITEGKRARDAFLLEISNTLAAHLDIRELLTAVAACLRQVKQFDEANLALYDPQSKMLRVQALEASAKCGEEGLIPVAGSPAGWAYTARRPLLLKGVANEKLPFDVRSQLADQNVQSACWIPLLGQDGALGTLNLFSKRAGTFTDDDLGILTQMANQIAIALGNALAFRRISELTQRLAQEKQYLEDELRTEFNFEDIVGESNALKRVLKQIETVAPTDSTVLILGETGTGKELIARAVHDLSDRREHNFVRVNCASIPTGLLESELFGHEKGAFTGAIAQRIGRLELAHQGTIFLDEVGDIPFELQPKLLRVLQEKQFERLGTSRTITVDVRIVAATNRDLGKMVAAGQFRSDLFYRLSVFPIVVPPLRDRREDIPLLVHYFVAQFAKRMNKQIESVAPETMQALLRYSWPGNIRELEHLIERAVILSRGPVLTVPQVELAQQAATPVAANASLEEMEREHILRVLRETNGKIGGPGGAAERLGMNRTTLNSRMQKLGISRKQL
jgi:formate hydrogenlyase transcriptional activator